MKLIEDDILSLVYPIDLVQLLQLSLLSEDESSLLKLIQQLFSHIFLSLDLSWHCLFGELRVRLGIKSLIGLVKRHLSHNKVALNLVFSLGKGRMFQ